MKANELKAADLMVEDWVIQEKLIYVEYDSHFTLAPTPDMVGIIKL